jgi:hypothetical protein
VRKIGLRFVSLVALSQKSLQATMKTREQYTRQHDLSSGMLTAEILLELRKVSY